MTQKLKRAFACVLSVVMLLSLIPGGALAAGDEYEAAFTETRLSEAEVSSDVVYKLSLTMDGFQDTGMIAISMVYDSDIITPINAMSYALMGGTVEKLLAPGENRHSGPGENRQFWPGENRQSLFTI